MQTQPRSRWRNVTRVGLLAFTLQVGAAAAADLPVRTAPPEPQLAAPQYTFIASAYLWATGLEGRVRTLPPFPPANVDIGFDDVLKNLEGGIMGAAEMRLGRYLFFVDIMATRLSPDKAIAPAGYPGLVKVQASSFTGLAAAGYRLIDDPAYSFDSFIGVRGFTMKNTLTVQVLPIGLRLSDSEAWIDAVAGARFRYNFTPSIHGVVMGFAGGGASKYQWDLFGGLGYDITNSFTLFAGYRAMKVDYRKGAFIYDALQQGPVLGLNSRF